MKVMFTIEKFNVHDDETEGPEIRAFARRADADTAFERMKDDADDGDSFRMIRFEFSTKMPKWELVRRMLEGRAFCKSNKCVRTADIDRPGQWGAE